MSLTDDTTPTEADLEEARLVLGGRHLRSVPPGGPTPPDWREQLIYSDSKGKAPKLAKHHANAVVILRYSEEWRGKIYFDEHAQKIRVSSPPWHAPEQAPGSVDEEGFREWTDSDDGRLSSWFIRQPGIGMELPPTTCGEAVRIAAEANPRHLFREYLDGLQWDGVERLDAALVDFFGVSPSQYTSNVFRWWMISAAARTYWPGCKADYVLILEGGQGIRKSTALRVLAGSRWFSDTPIRLDSKDRFQRLLGRVIIEMAEFKLDSKAAKDFFTSPIDDYRPPYGRREVSVPRRGVIAATMNPPSDGAYLTDETGGRRYWPVTCGEIDLRGLEAARDQLWAEAASLCQASLSCPECSPSNLLLRCAHHRWWPEGSEEHDELSEEQSQRTEGEPWQEAIGAWVSTRQGDLALNDVILGALKFENAGKIDKVAQRRASRALKGLGYRRVQLRESDGTRPWVYRRG